MNLIIMKSSVLRSVCMFPCTFVCMYRWMHACRCMRTHKQTCKGKSQSCMSHMNKYIHTYIHEHLQASFKSRKPLMYAIYAHVGVTYAVYAHMCVYMYIYVHKTYIHTKHAQHMSTHKQTSKGKNHCGVLLPRYVPAM